VHTLRRAVESDLPFVVTAIEAAESCGIEGRPTTYEKLFSLSRQELELLLRAVLVEDTLGHQLTLKSFFVLESEARPVATCAAWVEAEDGVASGFKTAALLSQAVGRDRWIAAKQGIRALSQATPPRTHGTLQMESFFVHPESRGKGLTARLIADIRAWYRSQNVVLPGCEISLLAENTAALSAYRRAGFDVQCEIRANNPVFHELTGGSGFIQLRSVHIR